MSLADQERSLTESIDNYRESRCAQILARADAEADEILARAYASARGMVHGAVVIERERAESRLHTVRAELQTQRRRRAQQHDQALLDAAWRRLDTELMRRWARASTRRAWIRSVVQMARHRLPPRQWVIPHAVDWPDAERQEARADLGSRLESAPVFLADPGIRAGISVRVGGANLDGTIDGLLADRTGVGARLLALFHREADA